MGGNALSYDAVRLAKADYVRMAESCTATLQAVYPGKRVHAIEAYRAKETFGDLDILIENAGFDPFVAARGLNATEVVRNGPVTSIGVRVRPDEPICEGNVFQVDFITIAPEAFDYAKDYFSFNDQGNLVGRLFHAAGLSHRHDGLYYYFRDGDYKFREILLTKDYAQALRFMGYSPDAFQAGFETLEDMFEFVASSEFFDSDIFLLENRNAQSRIRDRKRPSYTAFLKWCEVTQGLPEYSYSKDKKQWHARIEAFFPGFLAEYAQGERDLAELREVKSKFNGGLVSEWTGLAGKELGQVMAAWRKKFESAQAMHGFVLSQEQEALRRDIVELAGELALAGPGESQHLQFRESA